MGEQNAGVNLTEREQILLKALVEHYIINGQPVGSRTLARGKVVGLSSASIRNIMSDLEQLGLIKSPHTSAGRVPTINGYRAFVDSLISVQPVGEWEKSNIINQFETHVLNENQPVLEAASNLLSGITQMAAIVTLPKQNINKFRHIEFLPLSNKRVLVILVINQQEVKNLVMQVDREFTSSELEQAANYLNSEYAGKVISQIRHNILTEMYDAKNQLDKLMQSALKMASQAIKEDDDDDLVFAGQTNLMEFSDFSNMDVLRQLFEAFSQKQEILHLLDRCLDAEGVQIFIGNESGYQIFDDCTFVAKSYTMHDGIVGALGVIGPTRMNYERVIPIVDLTAKLLSSTLKKLNS